MKTDLSYKFDGCANDLGATWLPHVFWNNILDCLSNNWHLHALSDYAILIL